MYKIYLGTLTLVLTTLCCVESKIDHHHLGLSKPESKRNFFVREEEDYYRDFLTCEFLIGFHTYCATDGNVSFFDDKTGYYENFTNSFINDKNGFNLAFDYIQGVYESIAVCSNRNDKVCVCFEENMPYIYKPYYVEPWIFMFETNKRFELVKSLVTDLDMKYSHSRLPWNITIEITHNINLHKFCYYFSWNMEKINAFKQSASCVNSHFWNKFQFCLKFYIPDFNEADYFLNMTLLDTEKAELFLQCGFRAMNTVNDMCPLDFKKHVILHNVMLKHDLFESDEENLMPYLDLLVERSVQNYEKQNNRLTTWISGTGQVYSYRKKSIDLYCDYESTDEFICYQSNWISIYCYFGDDFPRSNMSQLSSIRFRFFMPNIGIITYSMNQTYAPGHFNETNSNKIIDPVTNATLLELINYEYFNQIIFSPLGTSFIFGTTWELSFYLVVRSYVKGEFYLGAKNGLLIDGCKNNKQGIIEKHITKSIFQDCLDKCNTISQNLATNSSIDEIMLENNIYGVCYYDCSLLKDLSSTDMTESLVNSINYARLSDLRFPDEMPISKGCKFGINNLGTFLIVVLFLLIFFLFR
jgi:hypothetical protein